NGGQPLIQLFVPPPLQAHQIAVLPGSDRIEIITGDHTSIADEDQAVEPESLVQVGDGLADGGVVHFVAGPDVMRDRPAGHHHHGDDHLDVVRLAIAAVAVLGKAGRRPGALEVGAGDVIEHQVRLEAEQVAEAMIEGHLDLLLGGHELIEGAVPGLELLEVDPDSLVLVPIGHEPAAPAIAEEVGLQPAKPCSLAGRMSRLATRTNARSANRTPLALPSAASRMVHSPSWSNRVRTARTGPQVEASRMSGSSASPVSARSPPRNRWSLGRISTKRSLRPRSARVRCLTLPLSR